MTNQEKYDKAFMDILRIGPELLNENLVYQRHKNWDSLAHMELMVQMEEAFDIAIDTVDVMAFSGYEAGKEILTKYGVDL